MDFIPVLKPKLPPAEALLPWLECVDDTRWYSNFGPLERRLRERLGDLAGVEAEALALFSSGTAALAIALRALVGKAGGLCLTPSWTHVGTASAVQAAGLEPYFVDCDAASWALDPAGLAPHLRDDVRAVIPVVPFGAAFDYARWDAFAAETGIAVVIDAAAAFDQFIHFGRQVPWGRTPVMVSLHGTKVFGVGEGGLLASADTELIRRTQQLGNFGIYDDSLIDDAFANAKMSEYHAAVGLAFADLWPERRRSLDALASAMAARLGAAGASVAAGFGGRFVSSTCMVAVPDVSADELERSFAAAAIGTRRWWREGVHTLPSFDSCGRASMAVTERLAAAFIGVPFYPDMPADHVDRVVERVARVRSLLPA